MTTDQKSYSLHSVQKQNGLWQRLVNLTQKQRISVIAVTLAVALGGYLRLHYAFIDPTFPIGDGGLFYRMTQDLIDNHFLLPSYTSYNAELRIPFAYPPLAFYLTAALSLLTGASPLQVMSFLPAFFCLLMIPAVYLFARKMMFSETQAALAVLIFALLPRSITWNILGGGITRSIGFFFTILTMWQARRLIARGTLREILLMALFASLVVYSHAEWAWVAFFSTALVFAFYGLNREAALNAFYVSAIVLVATAPWWGTVWARHGIDVFISAFSSEDVLHNTFIQLFYVNYNFTDEPMLPIIAVLGFVGFVVSIAQRKWFFPVWVVALFVLNNRNASTSSAVALSIMAAMALDTVIFPALMHYSRTNYMDVRHRLRPVFEWLPSVLFAGLLIAYAFYGALRTGEQVYTPTKMLSEGDRQAMRWIADHTPPNSHFVVLSYELIEGNWAVNLVAEWFPALAQRPNFATVQGTEWLQDGWHEHHWAYTDVATCLSANNVTCLDNWARQYRQNVTHVYISTDVMTPLTAAIQSSSLYRLIYWEGGVQIYERTEPIYFTLP